MRRVRIAVLCSGGGSNFQAVLDGCQDGRINGEIVALIYNRKNAYAARRAREAGIGAHYINKLRCGSAAAFTQALLSQLKACRAELIVLAGWLEILGEELIRAYPNQMINIHPALIPSFCGKGFYGRYVHEAALAYGVKISGCTVHFVSPVADDGPIILQRAVEVLPGDTPDTLAARILPYEHQALAEAVMLFCQGRLRVEGRMVSVMEQEKEEEK
ncbi:MAG: phosphoribosylglycinamide formyltransferase [Eubacteriales bacterium]|nr:phosphoribosylglycinamide formyltransferase [Eubacteriales bacterium]